MILLRPDCLVFESASGEGVPGSAEAATVELFAHTIPGLHRHVIENAAAAVLHYFRTDLGRTQVSVSEFSQVLKQVLHRLGFDVPLATSLQPRLIELDLPALAVQTGGAFELLFFAQLRHEMRCGLGPCHKTVRLNGLRRCVKQLIGAKRWSERCQQLNDQIVDFLRTCLRTEGSATDCSLIVL
jgi:hypothetical protein